MARGPTRSRGHPGVAAETGTSARGGRGHGAGPGLRLGLGLGLGGIGTGTAAGTGTGTGTGTNSGTPAGAGSRSSGGPPMAESDDPPRRDPAPAGPRTQPCRPVPRVHAFGKGEQALRRDPRTPPAMQGWLHKQLGAAALEAPLVRTGGSLPLLLPGSEQQVRGGLPLPGYEIRVLPAAPRAPRAPQFLFTAEHAGMRTYCLGAESAEELHAWVCALRRGASALPGSAPSLSQQALQEPRSADPPSAPLPTHSPGEGLGGTPVPPPCCPPVPPLPHSEVPQAQEESPAPGGPRGHPQPEPAARSPRKPRPPGAAPPERDTGTSQPPASPTASSDWLPSAAGLAGTAPAPASNEASRQRREGVGGRGRAREGVAGRPIRITLLQASF
ncbi:pleckstrin homology domain-containing family A member 4-like isoform X2 [Pyrgilauda ruficollis]|uniref:pleckstrin homology domain-containing family A member 4-like isoform X2 n=1 Tax=Pyrgilauda ruficollis TaxID=221976 RepID=UPI001B8610D2|nr:pleckstrin homology domain-containing family A member 4-like isoform X2 [Pyrgilauda ruficollis]